MKALALAVIVALSLAVPGVARAGGDVPFSYTSPGGTIPDDGIAFFSVAMNPPPTPEITSLQLDILGLSHSAPMDLDIYLINPFGNAIQIMTDKGDQVPVENVDLNFRDGASGVPPTNLELVSGSYQPEGLFNGTDNGFATYVGTSGGAPATWILVVSDDDPTGTGRFTSWTLRGTFVPEPMSLTLLAVGALALVRRRR